MSISRRRLLKIVGAGGLGALAPVGLSGSEARHDGKPRATNLVVIMTDNQGAWTLGCYGNKDIRTPNIDALARGGMRFTRAFSCNAVCSPTRASFLTGLIPSQHGVHSYLSAGGAQTGPKPYCTIGEFRTLPKVLSRGGYACGLVGKWHLGANARPQEGFRYWITTPHGHTTTFYGAKVIEDGKTRTEPTYLTDFWTRHGVKFIERNKDRPFFLFLTYNGPYGLGASLTRPARNRHAAYYADKKLPSFPRGPVHPWQRNMRSRVNNIKAIRRYAAEVSGVDDGVGEITATLKRLGLAENTLVVYTADQGWGGGQHGIWGMGDHTRPLHAFDATMHVPLIFRHSGAIRPGGTSERMVATYDLMDTILSCLGLAARTPTRPASPGRNFAPILRGRETKWTDEIFYEFENTRAIRTADWKYILRHPSGPNELYDLANDPGETRNLITAAAQAQTRLALRQRLEAFFKRHADPKYDLWRNGRSKARRLIQTAKRKSGPPPKKA